MQSCTEKTSWSCTPSAGSPPLESSSHKPWMCVPGTSVCLSFWPPGPAALCSGSGESRAAQTEACAGVSPVQLWGQNLVDLGPSVSSGRVTSWILLLLLLPSRSVSLAFSPGCQPATGHRRPPSPPAAGEETQHFPPQSSGCCGCWWQSPGVHPVSQSGL